MRILHGPLGRNNRHIYLAFIEWRHGLDSHAVAIGSPATINAHLYSEEFSDFLRTRVTFVAPGALTTPLGLLRALARIVTRGEFSTLHLYSLYSYLPVPVDLPRIPPLQGIANLDLSLLRWVDHVRGRSTDVFLHFQGCDVRTPAQYAGLYGAIETPCHSCAKRASYCGRRFVASRAGRLARLLAAASGAYVSTPDLCAAVPQARYLPQPFFFEEWPAGAPWQAKYEGEPKVHIVHAPSDSRRKGTVHIEAAVSKLREARAAITYTRAQGLSRSELGALLGGAHIFVDQLLVGYYGNALIEGVASGAVCAVNLKVASDPVENHVLNASVATIEAVLEDTAERILSRDPAIPASAEKAHAFFVARHAPSAIFRALVAGYASPGP